MLIYQPSIEVMVREVQSYIYKNTGKLITITFNNPFETPRHIDMLIYLYKIIVYCKDEDVG